MTEFQKEVLDEFGVELTHRIDKNDKTELFQVGYDGLRIRVESLDECGEPAFLTVFRGNIRIFSNSGINPHYMEESLIGMLRLIKYIKDIKD